ncbi:MAG: hypothetical protein M1828_002579 [Chrysothrix sp. TS-e1954]|nr:MAG: hypothetical protein M1828_002579 [Chrysothrix sp. TS-e1954]
MTTPHPTRAGRDTHIHIPHPPQSRRNSTTQSAEDAARQQDFDDLLGFWRCKIRHQRVRRADWLRLAVLDARREGWARVAVVTREWSRDWERRAGFGKGGAGREGGLGEVRWIDG